MNTYPLMRIIARNNVSLANTRCNLYGNYRMDSTVLYNVDNHNEKAIESFQRIEMDKISYMRSAAVT